MRFCYCPSFVGNMPCTFINFYIFIRISNFFCISARISMHTQITHVKSRLYPRYLLLWFISWSSWKFPRRTCSFFILSLMFLRKNRLFCSISHRISFTQKRRISALIPIGFPSAKMSISGLVLIGCRERSLEPHQCSSPICTILFLFIHTLYTLLFFKPKIKLWWTIIIEPPHCWGFSAVIRIIFANPAGRPKGFWRMELDQEDIRVHTNKNSYRVKIRSGEMFSLQQK